MHPYQAGAAHTHHAPHVMSPSVEYLQSVKISAYHSNVPKERGGDIGEQRGKRGMWVGWRGRRGRGRGGGEREGEREGRRGRGRERGGDRGEEVEREGRRGGGGEGGEEGGEEGKREERRGESVRVGR